MCAKVVDPLRSSEARGKVGGLSYNTWRGIKTVKSCGQPTNQYTAARTEARRKLIYWSKRWQLLSDAQRALWRSYADAHQVPDWTGNPVRLTGHQCYVGLSVMQERCAITPTGNPPALSAPAAAAFFTATYNAGTGAVDFAVNSGDLLSGQMVEVWKSGPHSAGRSPSIKESTALLLLSPSGSGSITTTFAAFTTVGDPPLKPWLNPNNARLPDLSKTTSTPDLDGISAFLTGTALDSPPPAGSTPVGMLIRIDAIAAADGYVIDVPEIYRPSGAEWLALWGGENYIPTDESLVFTFGETDALPGAGWTLADFTSPAFKARAKVHFEADPGYTVYLDSMTPYVYFTGAALSYASPSPGSYTFHARIVDSATGLSSPWLQAREDVPA